MPTLTMEKIRFSDGYEAAVRWWRVSNPRGAVLYFHGIQSHGGWYEESGRLLAEAGFTVLMPDRRGSGLNHSQRGHVESMDRAVADAAESLDALLKDSSQSVAHVIGVSWGGKLAVCLAAERPKQVASLSLIAPGLFPRVDITTAEKFRVAMSLINDRDRMFDIPLNDPRFFTANPARIQYVEQDALMLRQVSATFLLATRRMDRVVGRLGRGDFRAPVHLMLAGQDKIIHNEPTRRWLRGLPSPDRRTTEFPNAHHTLEFEPDPSQFHKDLVEGISTRFLS